MGKFVDILKKGLTFGVIEPDNSQSKPKTSKITNKILYLNIIKSSLVRLIFIPNLRSKFYCFHFDFR